MGKKEDDLEAGNETPTRGGTAWRITKAMLAGFQAKDSKYAAVLEKKDQDMAEANAAALAGAERTIRMLWISLVLCIILLGVVAGAIGTGTLSLGRYGELGLGPAKAGTPNNPSHQSQP